MPSADFGFKPTPQGRSWSELVGHVVNANFFFCSQARGEAMPSTVNHEQLEEKVVILKALTESLAYCDGAYAATTDTNFGEIVKLAGPKGGQALGAPFSSSTPRITTSTMETWSSTCG